VATGAALTPWVRLSGERGNVTPGRSDAEARWSFANTTVQAGLDSQPIATAGGEWVLGATVQFGDVSADVANAIDVGSIKASGFGIGATATWYGSNGLYVDTQAQLNQISASVDSIEAGSLAADRGMTSYGLSVETGWKVAMAHGSSLIPQAQLAWGSLSGGSFTDALGTDVTLGSNERMLGRIGLAWQQSLASGSTYYVIGNVLNDFSGTTTVVLDGDASVQSNSASWAEIGVGGTMALGQDKVLYAQANYQSALSGAGTNDAFGLNLGFKMQW
jgi:outer membrane autotransporter protein